MINQVTSLSKWFFGYLATLILDGKVIIKGEQDFDRDGGGIFE
jgi:hypothetical protein